MGLELSLYAVVAMLIIWKAFPSARRLRSQGESFARRNLAYVSPELVPAFDRAVTRADRFTAASFGLLAVGVLVAEPRSGEGQPLWVPLLLPLALVFPVWAGFRLWMATKEFPVPTGRATVARARQVSISDYVPRSAQVLTWSSAAVTVGTAATLSVLARRGEIDTAVAAWTAVGAGVTVWMAGLADVLGRLMCRRSQSAVDPCHLYLQDAWRAESLVAAHLAVYWSACMIGIGVVFNVDGLARLETALSPLPHVLVIAVIVWVASRSRWQFRRSLWRTLRDRQVLLPGEPVPPRDGVGV